MKTLIAVLFASSVAVACPKDTIEISGNCAEMPSPADQTLAPMIATSNEKPPSDKMPSYERPGIHVDEGIRAKEPETPVAHDSQAEAQQK